MYLTANIISLPGCLTGISNLACLESKLLTPPIIPGSPEQKTWSISKHLITAHLPGTPSENHCFYLQNVSSIKTRLIFLLLPMVQVTMVLFGLLLWPPNWSPCFCASPPHFRRKQWHPTPVLLLGKSHGWRSLVGCSPRGRKGLDTTEHLPFHFSLVCIGEGDGNPLQCYCLENPRDRGAWWADTCGRKSQPVKCKSDQVILLLH